VETVVHYFQESFIMNRVLFEQHLFEIDISNVFIVILDEFNTSLLKLAKFESLHTF